MSTSFLDVLVMWLGSGPSSPKYCQMVTPRADRTIQFGADQGGGPSSLLEFTFNDIGAIVAAPTNALVWRVPDLSSSALSVDDKAKILAAWPPLRRLNGAAFAPADARGDGSRDAILLEVFPAAYRRLEYLFSSLEIPVSQDDWDIPRYPTPRWFWIWGFGETGLANTFKAIAAKQWEPQPPPTIEGFLNGLAPIYVDAAETLGTFEDGQRVQVSAFDSTGLPIDPDFVFATFQRLADDSDFARLKVDHPENPAVSYEAAKRHVIVFSDQEGKPYTPLPAEPFSPTDPEAGTVEAERRLLLLSPGTGNFEFAEHGVLTFEAGSQLGDMSGPIGLGMIGTHVRFGSYPNGDIGKTITVDFAPQMFLRLQVLDYRDWFQRNKNPINRLTRYTEGNLITPLVDGANFLRELYRIMRATYKDVDPVGPSATFDPFAPVGDAPATSAANAKIYLANAWIEPDAPLLGRRGMIAAPKTQDTPPEDLPSFEDLMSRISFVAARSLPGLVDLPFLVNDQAQWWMVSDEGVLPPGSCVQMQQLAFASTFHGDDPRLPGELLNADIFGIVAPLEGGSSRGFVSTTGRFVLPVIFVLGNGPHSATVRITLWPANSPDPVARTYGQVTLPEPDNFMNRPPLDAGVNAANLRLVYEGTPGQVDLVLPAGTLNDARAVVVINPRSGESIVEEHAANANDEIRIALTDFALQDRVLVGFLPPGGNDASACPFFFEVFLGRIPSVPESKIDPTHADPAESSVAALDAGVAPVHPTELAGLLREAIRAGVDVRVLGWRDPTRNQRKSLLSTLGIVNSVNADFGGRRGLAMWDATTRETFHVHHQKGSFIRTASLDFIGFLGGIDLLNGRWDTNAHRQPDPERPSSTWHDVQCKVEGKAVWDLYRNFMQRWNAVNSIPEIVGADPNRPPLPPPDDPAWGPTSVVDDPEMTKADGPHAAQIVRTIAPHFDAYGGVAPRNIVDPVTGDQSVKGAWKELLKAADRYLYIEDQYFWIRDHALELHRWLKEKPERFLFLVIPRRFSDLAIGDQIHYALRLRCLNLMLYGVPDVAPEVDPTTLPDRVDQQVTIFHLISTENAEPIYVHSKLVIADDTWFTIGSANLSRRSWTFDSEINAACIDVRLRRGGHVSARQLRIDLLAEHLQLKLVETPLLEHPRDAFNLVREVLAGKRPWMRTHLLKFDPKFTHYGPFPENFDPVLRDAVNLVVDTDGTETHFDLGLMDAFGVFEALGDAGSGLEFGGLGRLTFNIDVSALARPAEEVLVRVEMREDGAPLGQQVTLGPWPATGPANAGLVRVGKTYVVQATALDATTLNTIGAAPVPAVEITQFLTTVDLIFS